jgi:hypothetical protein
MTILQTTTRPAAWRPGEAPTAADAGLPNVALALVLLAAVMLVYAAVRFAFILWSRRR